MTWQPISWYDPRGLGPRSYVCGHCGRSVGPNQGYYGNIPTRSNAQVHIYICSFCERPTYFEDDQQVPAERYGAEVEALPEGIGALYGEARAAYAASAFTASVLVCRKILMNVAVEEGADEGKPFIEYVDYLANAGYVPPNGRPWVDHIRRTGNEATHEIRHVSAEEAKELISFVEMLLKFVYEFPSRIPAALAPDVP